MRLWSVAMTSVSSPRLRRAGRPDAPGQAYVDRRPIGGPGTCRQPSAPGARATACGAAAGRRRGCWRRWLTGVDAARRRSARSACGLLGQLLRAAAAAAARGPASPPARGRPPGRAGTRTSGPAAAGSTAAGPWKTRADHPARPVDADEPQVGQARPGCGPGRAARRRTRRRPPRRRRRRRTATCGSPRGPRPRCPRCAARRTRRAAARCRRATSTTCWTGRPGWPAPAPRRPSTAGICRLPRSSRCDAVGRLGDVVRAVARRRGAGSAVAGVVASSAGAGRGRARSSRGGRCPPPREHHRRLANISSPVRPAPACPPVDPCPPAPRAGVRQLVDDVELCPLDPLHDKLRDPVTPGDLRGRRPGRG